MILADAGTGKWASADRGGGPVRRGEWRIEPKGTDMILFCKKVRRSNVTNYVVAAAKKAW
jgi:hypothetical protein